MDEVIVKGKIINKKIGIEKEIEFLVDTGATISVIPDDILKLLKVKATDKDRFELANGKTKVFRIGEVEIKINSKSHTFPVAAGVEKSQPLLGVVVLEVFGFTVDPISKKLKKRKLLMY